MTGDGKTAAKASAGRYYYVLSTGGGGVSNVNPNANYSEQYTWNDLNGDHKFQIGEQTGTPVVTAVIVERRDRSRRSIRTSAGRTPTSTASASIARSWPNTKLSAVYTYRREKNTAGDGEPRRQRRTRRR